MSDNTGYLPWLAVTVFVGLMLSIYPLPAHYAWFRPEFLALVCIFWSVFCPYRFGVVMAWCIGLLQDIVVGDVWGAHALSLAFIAYLCLCSYQRLRSYRRGQQMLWVFVLVGIHEVFVNWVQGLNGYAAPVVMIILPTLITALCWPLVVGLLKPTRNIWQG